MTPTWVAFIYRQDMYTATPAATDEHGVAD